MFCDDINATITFQQLAKKRKKTDTSVHRKLGPRGNPRADTILEIIKFLQLNERGKLRVRRTRRRSRECLIVWT